MSDYYDLRTIREELRYCAHLFERWDWQMIDVTRRAIEEVSLEIIGKRGLGISL
jgi:regulator of PEP synthase PpsR (kinase-PPPase family)